MLGLGGSAGAASGVAGGGTPGASVDLSSLPIRAFLDQSVVPVLLQALCALVRERCVVARARVERRGLRGARVSVSAPTSRRRAPSRPAFSPRARPPNPVEWLAHYLLANNPQMAQALPQPPLQQQPPQGGGASASAATSSAILDL